MQIGVSPVVLAATMNDSFRKPNPGMWQFYCDNLSGGVAPGGWTYRTVNIYC